MEGSLNFVIIGARNSGKTVYLSTLFEHGGSIAAANDETIRYLSKNWGYLEQGAVPPATSAGLIRLFFSYKSTPHSVKFHIDDYDGYFAETLSTPDQITQEARDKLKSSIMEAEGLLFFFPYEKDHNEEVLKRFKDQVHTYIKIVSDIYDKEHKTLPIPVIIAVSKWDRSPHFIDLNEQSRADEQIKVDEKSKAIQYIESVDYYKKAMDQLKHFFSNVDIIPLSSFGYSKDGNHPIIGRITPYNLTVAFDYFLEITFAKFEDKAKELKNSGDIEKRFKFLSSIREDVRHYKDGQLLTEYNEVEAEYGGRLLKQLLDAPSSKHEAILGEHEHFLSQAQDESLLKNIAKAKSEVRMRERGIKGKRYTVVAALVIVIGYLSFAYHGYMEELNKYNTIIQLASSGQLTEELNGKTTEYMEKYKIKTLFLPFTDVISHRESVEKALVSLQAGHGGRIEAEYHALQKVEPRNEQLLTSTRDLERRARAAGNSTLLDGIRDFQKRLEVELRSKSENQAAINKAETVLVTNSSLEDCIKALENLQDVATTPQVEDLRQRLKDRIASLDTERAAASLLASVRSAEIDRIPEIIDREFKNSYPGEVKANLRNLIQARLEEQDRRLILDLQGKGQIEKIYDLDSERKKIAIIGRTFVAIERIDFQYQRSHDLATRFEDAKQRIAEIDKFLKAGAKASPSFIAEEKSNKPLNFSCPSFKSISANGDLIFKIDSKEFSYKDSDASCVVDGKTQTLSWSSPIYLDSGSKRISVELKGWFSNYNLSGTVYVTDEHLLNLYNGLDVILKISGQYYVKFRKSS